MIKVLVKRVPKVTNHAQQKQVINEWGSVIAEIHTAQSPIKIISAKDISGQKGSITITINEKK